MELKIGKAGGRDFFVDAQELVTGRTCIIAQSGAGKSWSIAVLCEKMCRNNIGFCLIDTEGEYYSLKEKYSNIWWVGAEGGDEDTQGIKMDFDIEKVNIHHILQRAVAESRPVIYDVSEIDMIPRVTKMVHELYEVATDQRKPFLLIVEEADKFIPQSKDSIKKIEEISRRGRKRGLGLMVATQRPAIVTKNVLSQCNNRIIGKLSIDNDLKAVSIFFNSKQEVEELTTLNPGDFFVMGSLVREKTKMRFGRRETQHRGLTPLLEYREISTEEDPLPEEEEADDTFSEYDSHASGMDTDDSDSDLDTDMDTEKNFDEPDLLDRESEDESDENSELLDSDSDDGIDFIPDSEYYSDEQKNLADSDGLNGDLPSLEKTGGEDIMSLDLPDDQKSSELGLSEIPNNKPVKSSRKKAVTAKSVKKNDALADGDESNEDKKKSGRKSALKAKTMVAERVSKEAVTPLIEREDALNIALARIKKKKFGFGTEERLLSAELIYIPLIHVSVKYIGGIIKKAPKTSSFLIDGRDARRVSISGALKYQSGFEEYVGLDEASVIILDTMSLKGETAAEMEASTHYPKKIVDKVIQTLKSKKLITESETLGESKKPVYVPLVSTHLPDISQRGIVIDHKMGAAEGGVVEKKTVSEEDIRTILKIMETTAEIIKFDTFYYPVYKVTIACGRDERVLFIDAVVGKEISF